MRCRTLQPLFEKKIGELSFKPFDAVGELKSFDYVQISILNLKKVENEETLKQLTAEVQSFWPLFAELAESVTVACNDLGKARKEREKRVNQQKRAQQAVAKKAAKVETAKKEKAEANQRAAQEAQASTLAVEVLPFTAPSTCGSPMKTFVNWSDAKDKLDAEALKKPFMIADAASIGDHIDSRQLAVFNSRLMIFKQRWRHADALAGSNRTQLRASKNLEPLLAFFNEVVKPPNLKLPAGLDRLGGVAFFGSVKGSTAFQPDYMYMTTLRYSWQGDRSVVAIPADEFLEFAQKNCWVGGGASGGEGAEKKDDSKDLQELHDFGGKYIDEKVVKSLVDSGVELVHAQIGPNTCVFIPGNYYVWDSCHSDCAGIRYSFPLDSFESLTKLCELKKDLKDDFARTLKDLKDWHNNHGEPAASGNGEVMEEPPAAPEPAPPALPPAPAPPAAPAAVDLDLAAPALAAAPEAADLDLAAPAPPAGPEAADLD